MAKHIQTIVGGMGTTDAPRGKYRRDCSCGFKGPWVSFDEAAETVCQVAIEAVSKILSGVLDVDVDPVVLRDAADELDPPAPASGSTTRDGR